MSEHEAFPESLDAQLRQVPVPTELLVRLRGIATWNDAELDHQLRAVPVPAGLVARVQQAVADEHLDERLRAVPLPAHVLPRVRQVSARRRRSPWVQWALAASLLLVVGTGYYGTMAGVMATLRPRGVDAWTLLVIDEGPLDLVSPPEVEVAIVAGPPVAEDSGLPETLLAEEPDEPWHVLAGTSEPGPAGRLFRDLHRQWDPWENWLLARWSVLGSAHRGFESLPELETVSAPLARGSEVPLTRAVDREFLYSRGTLPPVLVSVDAAARVVTPPLSTETASFHDAQRQIAAGRWPDAQTVRVEDFLAAMPYRLAPVAPGQLALRTAAGPAVFNAGAQGLLQVAVAAGPPRRQAVPATHVTVALDVSSSLAGGQRLAFVQQGLERLVPQLGPEDRFSLLLFDEEVRHVVEEAEAADAAALWRIFDRLRPAGGVDLGAGLQQAVAAALESDAGGATARRLVLVTASHGALTQTAADRLHPLVAAAHAQGLRLDVLDLSGEAEADPRLTRLAQAAGGHGRCVRSVADIRWALLETVTGEASLVATEARLQVAFNPKTVAAYRLIGHESLALGGLLPTAVTADVRVGEEATALFELWLYPQGEEELAVATLQWTDPRTGEPRRLPPQRISTLQFATSFEGSPLPLQAAALAAEAGEILRQSYTFELPLPGVYRFRPKPRTLQEVLQMAHQVSSPLAERPEFQRFLAILNQASRLPPDRRPGPAKAGTRGITGGHWRELRD